MGTAWERHGMCESALRVREAPSVVVKRPELEADHAPLCTAEYNYPHVFVVWCFIKHW
jgi:hypothetical protein